MANEAVATVDNPPASGGVPQSGTNDLDASVAAELGLTPGNADTTPVQPSSPTVGAPVATPTADGAPTTAPAPAAAPTDPPAVDAATQTRLQQDLAQKNDLLRAMGIDPDGDTVELAVKGIIDPLTLIKNPQAPVQPVAQPTVSPQLPLGEKLANVQRHLKSGDRVNDEMYKEDIGALFDVVRDLTQANDTSQQQQRQQRMADIARNNTDATFSVVNQSEAYKGLVPEQQEYAKALILGATDVKAAAMAADPNIGTAGAFRPETYAHIAKSVTGHLETLLATAFENGKVAATQSIANPNTPVNPAQPGGGGSPVTPAQPKITPQTLDDAVNGYLANSTLPGLA